IVSGGHTDIVYVEKEMEFKIIGQTLDDAAGESFDKVAKMLKLGYPGGPLIDKISKGGKVAYKLPTPMDDKSLDFSFSGLKSSCFNIINTANMKGEVIEIADFAFSFQSTVVEILLKKLKAATNKYDVNTLSIVGGVSANSYLQKRALEEFSDCIIPSLILSTDNAAMIGVVGFHLYNRKEFVNGVLNAKPGIDVECMWKD
ncbi:MAG: tRNA (adenosine(37)-N6)-threonylcarbamoyltransferase complex transferase subunit TsaD, partial [Mycoplasmatales bacterium]